MRRGEGTGWGDEREQGKGRGEAAGAAGWAGEAQGQEEGRGRSSGVGIYLEGWGRGAAVIHAFTHLLLVAGRKYGVAFMNSGSHSSSAACLPARWPWAKYLTPLV